MHLFSSIDGQLWLIGRVVYKLDIFIDISSYFRGRENVIIIKY